MEEYKRPTFKVEFPSVNTRYQDGDTLSIEAKAMSYAGVPVQGAKVKYRVIRRPSLWWSPWYRTDDSNVIIKEEETITDGDGQFDVSLPLILPEEKGIRRFYNFTVEADVTDISGETHSGEMSIPLGSRPTAISSSIAEKELGDSLKSVTVYLKNQAGINVNTPVRMRIDEGECGACLPFQIGVAVAEESHGRGGCVVDRHGADGSDKVYFYFRDAAYLGASAQRYE